MHDAETVDNTMVKLKSDVEALTKTVKHLSADTKLKRLQDEFTALNLTVAELSNNMIPKQLSQPKPSFKVDPIEQRINTFLASEPKNANGSLLTNWRALKVIDCAMLKKFWSKVDSQ